MRNYKTGRSSNRKDYRSRSNFGRKEMHNAVCDECGKKCKVPFKPSGDKPIYCSECFEQKTGISSSRSDRRRSGNRYPRENRMYQTVCDKCGKDCEVPFKPTSGKPVYCDNCFKGTGKGFESKKEHPKASEIGNQLDGLNNKIDLILQKLDTLNVEKEKIKKTRKTSKKNHKEKTEGKDSVKKTSAKSKKKKPVKKKAKKTTKKAVSKTKKKTSKK